MDRPEWVSFYEMDDPKVPEMLGRNPGGHKGLDKNSGGGDGVDLMNGANHGEGMLIQGVAVIKQAILVDSPLYLQVCR